MPARVIRLALVLALALPLGACGPPITQTGYLSDYSRLEKVGDKRLEFVSDEIQTYRALIIEPIVVNIPPEHQVLNDEQRADVTAHFQQKLGDLATDKGFLITKDAGDRVARLRLAITSVRKPLWFLNIHPGSKMSGAGLGGATMEGEIVDSITGAQLAAVVQASRGNQFEIDTFSGTDDVKDAINRWISRASDRIDEIRAERQSASAD